MPADLLSDDAQVVKGVGIVGLNREDLSIQRLRFRQPARLVALEREFEGLWDGHGKG